MIAHTACLVFREALVRGENREAIGAKLERELDAFSRSQRRDLAALYLSEFVSDRRPAHGESLASVATQNRPVVAGSTVRYV